MKVNWAADIIQAERLRRAAFRSVMANWLPSLAPWQAIAHLTFEWQASIWSADRCYKKFMSSKLQQVSYFYVVEPNPSRDGFHVHALWCDCGNQLSEIWRCWSVPYGRNRIEPIRNIEHVSAYCTKYVSNDDAWWDVRLVGHRHPRYPSNLKPPQA
jgi:hypothetical protein